MPVRPRRLPTVVILLSAAIHAGCESSPRGTSNGLETSRHGPRTETTPRRQAGADVYIVRERSPDPAKQARTPEEAWQAVVRLFVPKRHMYDDPAQGAGIYLTNQEIVTAQHVLGDTETMIDRLRMGTIEQFHTSERMVFGAVTVFSNEYRDTARVRLATSWDIPKGVVLSPAPPVPGERLTALLVSTQRGDDQGMTVDADLLGYSRDGAFFALGARAQGGDSGGPVLNARGELVGIVLGGGGEEIGIPFDIDRLEDGHFKTGWFEGGGTQRFRGGYTICAVVK